MSLLPPLKIVYSKIVIASLGMDVIYSTEKECLSLICL